MRPLMTYRHISTYDIELTVLRITYKGPRYIKVKGIISNRHNGIVYEKGTYKILKEDILKWQKVISTKY